LPAKIWQHRIQPTAPAAPISTGTGTICRISESTLAFARARRFRVVRHSELQIPQPQFML
jgi:hypothetical protein